MGYLGIAWGFAYPLSHTVFRKSHKTFEQYSAFYYSMCRLNQISPTHRSEKRLFLSLQMCLLKSKPQCIFLLEQNVWLLQQSGFHSSRKLFVLNIGAARKNFADS